MTSLQQVVERVRERSDEPSFIIGITGLKSNETRLFGPFEDVDGVTPPC